MPNVAFPYVDTGFFNQAVNPEEEAIKRNLANGVYGPDMRMTALMRLGQLAQPAPQAARPTGQYAGPYPYAEQDPNVNPYAKGGAEEGRALFRNGPVYPAAGEALVHRLPGDQAQNLVHRTPTPREMVAMAEAQTSNANLLRSSTEARGLSTGAILNRLGQLNDRAIALGGATPQDAAEADALSRLLHNTVNNGRTNQNDPPPLDAPITDEMVQADPLLGVDQRRNQAAERTASRAVREAIAPSTASELQTALARESAGAMGAGLFDRRLSLADVQRMSRAHDQQREMRATGAQVKRLAALDPKTNVERAEMKKELSAAVRADRKLAELLRDAQIASEAGRPVEPDLLRALELLK
jgi:hypothetical protein